MGAEGETNFKKPMTQDKHLVDQEIKAVKEELAVQQRMIREQTESIHALGDSLSRKLDEVQKLRVRVDSLSYELDQRQKRKVRKMDYPLDDTVSTPNSFRDKDQTHSIFENVFSQLNYYPICDTILRAEDSIHCRAALEMSNQYIQTILAESIDQAEPLVSIVMPTYNRAKVIGNAIKSIISQTYSNWELIVVDDNSQDETSQVIESLSEARIKYIRLHQNAGVSHARNVALKASRGGFVAYLDSDNTWDPRFLSVMIRSMQKHGASVAYSAQRIVSQGAKEKLIGYRFNRFYRSLLENRNYIDLNAFMHAKRLTDELGDFEKSMNRLVDWDLILRYTEVHVARFVPAILGTYYFDDANSQISSTIEIEPNLAILKSKNKSDFLSEMILRNLPGSCTRDLYNLNTPSSFDISGKMISIIIPSFEALQCLKAAVNSIAEYTPKENFELIIVDNASSRQVTDYLLELERNRQAKIILNENNLGFTYAVNQGISVALKGNDILIFNNDAIVTKGWLNALYECRAIFPDSGLIVPRQVLPARTKTASRHVPMADLKYETDVNLSYHHSNVIKTTYLQDKCFVELSFAAFFCVLIPNETLRRLGPLNHFEGRHYNSDRLYCELAREKGLKVIYTPYSKVYHLLQQSTSELKENKDQYQEIFVENIWKSVRPSELPDINHSSESDSPSVEKSVKEE